MPCWPAIGADVAEQEIIGEEFLEEEVVVEDEIEDLGWPYSPKASWTGRIAETETAWTSGGNATRRAYRYDGMGRLRSATTRTDIDWPLQRPCPHPRLLLPPLLPPPLLLRHNHKVVWVIVVSPF